MICILTYIVLYLCLNEKVQIFVCSTYSPGQCSGRTVQQTYICVPSSRHIVAALPGNRAAGLPLYSGSYANRPATSSSAGESRFYRPFTPRLDSQATDSGQRVWPNDEQSGCRYIGKVASKPRQTWPKSPLNAHLGCVVALIGWRPANSPRRTSCSCQSKQMFCPDHLKI